MLVLGLDPSLTNFGWALHRPLATDLAQRLVARGRFQTPSKMQFVDRYVQLREELSELVEEHNPDFVGVESPVFKEMFSEGMYALFVYSNEALKRHRKDVAYFTPMQVKALAREHLGRPKGWKMEKPDMVEAAGLDTGVSKWNHNEADAYLVAKTAGRFWQFFCGLLSEDQLTESEHKLFCLIHQFKRGKKAGKQAFKGMVFREEDRFFLWSQT
jgi:Holliday junction resolvasome RuvABC endonuclease subunit